jgi:hypothetical protein
MGRETSGGDFSERENGSDHKQVSALNPNRIRQNSTVVMLYVTHVYEP